MNAGFKIKCLVVDDEVPAQDILMEFISKIDALQLEGICNNAIEAINFLQRRPVDLIFLDIQMPQLTGTEFLKSLSHPPKVIFTSAYANYAAEAFDLEAVDYLIKPIAFNRFVKAVNRVLNVTGNLFSESHESVAPVRPEEQSPFMYFRSERKMIKVFLKDIIYVESMKDYLKVVTTTGQIITKQSISALEEMLPGDTFIRIHRSYIVSINKIDSYNQELIEINKTKLPIGKFYRKEVNKQLSALL